MGYYDRCVQVPKNKLKACAFCMLLCMANLIEISEARKVATGRVTKPTANRGYANPDIAKLSYSPNHAAVPAKTAPAPAPAAAQQPPIGWNVHNTNNAPPPYSATSNHGPPPPYSAQPNPNVNSRFNEAPPPYSQSNPGFPPAPNYQTGQAAGFGAAGGVVAGNAYRPHGHNISAGGLGGGFAPVPNAGYPAQPAQGFPGVPPAQPGGGFPPGGFPQGGFPQGGFQQGGFQQGGYQQGGFQPGGFPQQPGYQPPAGGFQQPGTVVHHYEQPSSGGSGIGTVLGAGVVGLAAGAGGAAIYDALKPKDEHKEAPVDGTSTTTTSTTLAPINPNGDAPLAPLAPAPANPNGETPLAPMPVVPPNPNGDTPLATMAAGETTTNDAAAATETTLMTTDNPMGMVPLAALPNSTSVDTASTSVSTVAVEAPNAALNAQPNQAAPVAATIAPQHSDSAVGKVELSIFALLIPVICRLFL